MSGNYFPILIAIYEMFFAVAETMKHYLKREESS